MRTARGWPGASKSACSTKAGRCTFWRSATCVYGVDADIARTREIRREHVRRLAEVANLMLDAGMILIVSAQELTQEELELIKTTTVDPSRIETVWVGDPAAADLTCDLMLVERDGEEQNVERVRTLLVDKGILFQPW